jgi:hypothetical protein
VQAGGLRRGCAALSRPPGFCLFMLPLSRSSAAPFATHTLRNTHLAFWFLYFSCLAPSGFVSLSLDGDGHHGDWLPTIAVRHLLKTRRNRCRGHKECAG